MYQGRSIPHVATIGSKTIQVDSYLEERVIRLLDENGFQELWTKPSIGLNVGKHNYTPDIELSVLLPNGKCDRAIVEIKPALHFLTPYIWKRMVGVAKYYHSQTLLLYAEKQNGWYSIDYKTGELKPCTIPTPGNIPIKKLYKPFNIPATQIYNHHYKKKAGPALAKGILGFATELAKAPFVTPKKPTRLRKRK